MSMSTIGYSSGTATAYDARGDGGAGPVDPSSTDYDAMRFTNQASYQASFMPPGWTFDNPFTYSSNSNNNNNNGNHLQSGMQQTFGAPPQTHAQTSQHVHGPMASLSGSQLPTPRIQPAPTPNRFDGNVSCKIMGAWDTGVIPTTPSVEPKKTEIYYPATNIATGDRFSQLLEAKLGLDQNQLQSPPTSTSGNDRISPLKSMPDADFSHLDFISHQSNLLPNQPAIPPTPSASITHSFDSHAVEHALQDYSQVMIHPDLVAPMPPQDSYWSNNAGPSYDSFASASKSGPDFAYNASDFAFPFDSTINYTPAVSSNSMTSGSSMTLPDQVPQFQSLQSPANSRHNSPAVAMRAISTKPPSPLNQFQLPPSDGSAWQTSQHDLPPTVPPPGGPMQNHVQASPHIYTAPEPAWPVASRSVSLPGRSAHWDYSIQQNNAEASSSAPPSAPISRKKRKASDPSMSSPASGNSSDASCSSTHPHQHKSSASGDDGDKKVVIACYNCRAKKLRCDGAKPRCHNCVRRGEDVCESDKVLRRRGPGKLNKSKRGQAAQRQRQAAAATTATETVLSATGDLPAQHAQYLPRSAPKRPGMTMTVPMPMRAIMSHPGYPGLSRQQHQYQRAASGVEPMSMSVSNSTPGSLPSNFAHDRGYSDPNVPAPFDPFIGGHGAAGLGGMRQSGLGSRFEVSTERG